MGNRIELAAGLNVTGVRAGLGRITAYPSGRLGVVREIWLLFWADDAAVPTKSRVLGPVPAVGAMSPLRAPVVAVVGEGGTIGDWFPFPP